MIELAPLTICDLTAWLALRRVNEGGMALLDGSYYHYGRAVPHYLNAPLADLIKAGWLILAEANPDTGGMRKVTLTEGGREFYGTLCGKRGVSPEPRSVNVSNWPIARSARRPSRDPEVTPDGHG